MWKKLTCVWNRRVLFKWFAIFQDGLLAIKRKRQLCQRSLSHRKKSVMLQSVYWWHQLARGERVAQTVSKVVQQMRTKGVIRKLNSFWRLACSKALHGKHRYNRAMMVCSRFYSRKAWNRWLQLATTAAHDQCVASQFYTNKVKYKVLSRWILFFKKSVDKARNLLASSKQREMTLIELSFKSLVSFRKRKHILSKRNMSFIHRRIYKIKRECFQHWFKEASRNKRKRDSIMFMIMKKERHSKQVVLSYLASQASQRKLINEFLLKQSLRRG